MEEISTDNRKKTIRREEPIRTRIVSNGIPDLFENNETMKDFEINIHLKPGRFPTR